MKKRVLLINSIGMALVALAVACGIGCIGSIGAIEWGMVSITRGAVQAVACGVGTVVLGKLGIMFCEV